jgi:hypothetical protein
MRRRVARLVVLIAIGALVLVVIAVGIVLFGKEVLARKSSRPRPAPSKEVAVSDAFTIHHVSPAALGWWRFDDPRVEQLWLPLIGPTPFCLLRMFHNDLTDLFEPYTYAFSDVADSLGVNTKRAVRSLHRLEHFGLVDDDEQWSEDEAELVIAVPYNVRPIGEFEWARLPASVRERHSTLEL